MLFSRNFRTRRPASRGPRNRGQKLQDHTSETPARGAVVGVTGIGPVTSSLSGTRSNQLSYTPRSKNQCRMHDAECIMCFDNIVHCALRIMHCAAVAARTTSGPEGMRRTGRNARSILSGPSRVRRGTACADPVHLGQHLAMYPCSLERR